MLANRFKMLAKNNMIVAKSSKWLLNLNGIFRIKLTVKEKKGKLKGAKHQKSKFLTKKKAKRCLNGVLY